MILNYQVLIFPLTSGFWVTGGIDGGTVTSTTELYTTSGSWIPGPALPQAVWGHCVVQIDNDNTLLVAGLNEGQFPVNNAAIF